MKYSNHIKRSVARDRMYTVWGGLQTTKYQMGGKDCSQYAVDVWNLFPHDYNTETFVTTGVMVEIPVQELRPADAVGKCGPGTSGAHGHIELFVEWQDQDNLVYLTLEQDGKGLGPHYNSQRHPSYYRAYRFTGMIEDLNVPDKPTPIQYTVKSGDSLASIARRYNTTAITLYRDNIDVIESAAKRRGRTSFGPDVNVNGIAKHSVPGWWIWPGTVLTIYGSTDA